MSCEAGAKAIFRGGATCFAVAWAGEFLIKRGHRLSGKDYESYKRSVEVMSRNRDDGCYKVVENSARK